MKPPFTVDHFLNVFREYNEAVFPVQIIFFVLGMLAVFLAVKPMRYSASIISSTLAFFWIWMGVVYHLIFFTAINPAANLFGAVFILQGILFVYLGVFRDRFSFKFRVDRYGIAGVVLIVFAMVVYPVLGSIAGHTYPASPTFGLPCPTTIFTLGFLLMNRKGVSVPVLIIPVAWSVIGFTAALSFGMVEDVGLLVAGILTVTLVWIRNRQAERPTRYPIHSK